MFGSLLLIGTISTWLTPIWLIGVGVALGMAVLAVLFAIAYLVARPLADVMVASVREGILLPVFYLAAFLAAFAVIGAFLVPQLPLSAILASTGRLSEVGTRDYTITVPALTRDYELEDIHPRLVELVSFTAEVDHPLTLATNVSSGLGQTLSVKIGPDGKAEWNKPLGQEWDKAQRERTSPEALAMLTASNVNADPVVLRLHTVTDLEFPEVRIVPLTALALIALFVVYVGVRVLFPKVAAIALTTSKESMAQPLFYMVLGVGCVALLAFIFIPYNTFGEDIKLLKDSGLTLIMVLSIIVAVWSASVSISEEVEGRTALTVLSKPVQRRQFILGKFLGILGPVVVLFILLGLLFLVTISFKVVYDAREGARQEPSWELCYSEMVRIIPGLVLAFLETVVLASISVAISTRLSMLANLLICASVYVLGNLVPMLVNSSVGKFEIVRFVGQFIATVLPVLDHYNIQAAIAAGKPVPIGYLGMALLYCVVYSTIAMLLGLAMFEDRDLA